MAGESGGGEEGEQQGTDCVYVCVHEFVNGLVGGHQREAKGGKEPFKDVERFKDNNFLFVILPNETLCGK